MKTGEHYSVGLLKIKIMSTVLKRSRQARALRMLEAQLKSGVKTEKKSLDVKIPLTESDKVRIGKEIELLKSRIQ